MEDDASKKCLRSSPPPAVTWIDSAQLAVRLLRIVTRHLQLCRRIGQGMREHYALVSFVN